MFHTLIQNSNTETTDIFSGDVQNSDGFNSMLHNPLPPPPTHQQQKTKKKRNLPGNPDSEFRPLIFRLTKPVVVHADPDAEVIALSPKTLLATNRFVCEICNKGFQRDQNLQLHRRGHNLPWKLKQRSSQEIRKRAYVCPEPSCLHHHPSRALGDLTGIKKHYCRKHGEKKWKCEKCSKIYAVQSDWKAHSKTCGTREYRCDCGTLFSRKDSFITHRAFCDALAEESARLSAATNSILAQIPNDNNNNIAAQSYHFQPPRASPLLPFSGHCLQYPEPQHQLHIKHENLLNIPHSGILALHSPTLHGGLPSLSATGPLQRATTVGSTMAHLGIYGEESDGFTRDFLGLTGDQCRGGGPVREMMPFLGNSAFHAYVGDHNSTLKQHGFGFSETCSGWGNSVFF